MQAMATILIVDRNPNVRKYLKRELGSEGYHLLLAENCREVFQIINSNTKFDLVIIDPDLPDIDETSLFRKLQGLRLHTPIVIHTLLADCLTHCRVLIEAVLIEKDGNSIERLKRVVTDQLQRLPSSEASQQCG